MPTKFGRRAVAIGAGSALLAARVTAPFAARNATIAAVGRALAALATA
ncbi:MAG: hypothetical protein J0I21_06505 [Alphaproteobacteria bacterium]|nr:hypothetical protein [Alphaproteobacteria bacterium]